MDEAKLKHLKQRIINYVHKSDRFVNFAEMSREIDGFSGNISYGASTEYPYRVIWPKLSQEAIAIIEEIDGSKVFMWPASIADYSIEDRIDLLVSGESQMPVGFSEETDPFWRPMVFWKEPY